MAEVDFSVVDGGSVFLLIPENDEAKSWVSDYIGDDVQTFGRGVVVEHRYIADIVNGIINDGFTVA